jgi:hypothetical protein
MRPKGLARCALAVAGIAGLAIAAALPAGASTRPARASTQPMARASTTPGWRVVSKLGPSEGDWSIGLDAVSATDAWSTWAAVGNDDLEHWNGHQWQRVSVPAGLVSDVAGNPNIAATAGSGLWLFGSSGSIIHYDGGKWRVQTIPKWAVHGNLSGESDVTPAVFSLANVWVFSLGWDKPTSPDHYAAHYNGKAWTKVELPAVPYSVSAVSPTDIWAYGPSPQNMSTWVLMHWNGKTWATVPMPKVRVPKGDTAQFYNLLGAGPASAWFVANIETASFTTVKTELLHWTGRSWGNVALGYPTTNLDIAPDGGGGLWAAAWGPGPAYTEHLDHLSGGHWSQYAIPDGVNIQPPNLIWIPGTRSLWATGDLTDKNVVYGTTLKFGP